MPSFPFLPAELIDMIIDHLHNDKQTLATCTLVSQNWLKTSRFHLIPSVTISPRNFSTIIGLLTAPHSRLATSVGHLTLAFFGFMKEPPRPHIYPLDDFPRIIKHFPSLNALMFIDVAWETLDQFQTVESKISKLNVVACFFTSERQLFQLLCLFPAVKDLECNLCKCSVPPSPCLSVFQIPATLKVLRVDQNGLEMLVASGEQRLYSGLESLEIIDISFSDSVEDLLQLSGNTLVRLKISYSEDIYNRAVDVVFNMGDITLLESLDIAFPPILDVERPRELSLKLTSFVVSSLASMTSPLLGKIKFVMHALTPNTLKCIDWAGVDKIFFDNPNFRQLRKVIVEIYPLPHARGAAARDAFREKHGAESERIIYSGLEQTARLGRLLVRYSKHYRDLTGKAIWLERLLSGYKNCLRHLRSTCDKDYDTCTNRWYDKLQIIICADGAAGINFEHTGVDGITVLRFAADIFTQGLILLAKSINPSAPTLLNVPLSPYAKANKVPRGQTKPPSPIEKIDTTPKKLEWNLTPELRAGGYGKNFITSHGFSPDAFVQMAFQAAYFGFYGRTECVYEPAMTKAFLHGRTEAIRSTQLESVNFTKTFYSEASSSQKVAALRKACERHVKLTKECSQGLGQDRHLYAIYCLVQRQLQNKVESEPNGLTPPSPTTRTEPLYKVSKMPSIFTDSGWPLLGTSIISLSNCGNPALRLFGFGPVADGYGIGYIIKEDGISVCGSSKHLQTRRFLDTLQGYLLDMQRVLIQLHRSANQRPAPFVDHAGILRDSKTGRPIHGATSDSSDGEDEEFALPGYSFFDAGGVALLGRKKKSPFSNIGKVIPLAEY